MSRLFAETSDEGGGRSAPNAGVRLMLFDVRNFLLWALGTLRFVSDVPRAVRERLMSACLAKRRRFGLRTTLEWCSWLWAVFGDAMA